MRLFSFPPSVVVLFIGIYLPFEGYILYITGVGDVLAMLMKAATELILYVVFLVAVLHRLGAARLKHSPIDLPVLLLVMVALLATWVYSASFVSSINNMRALLRYLSVFYLVYYFGFSAKKWDLFSRLFIAVVAINVFLALAQFGLGDAYPDVLKVGEKMRVSIGSDAEVRNIGKEEKIGAVQGLLEAPGVFGAFLVAAMAIMLARLGATNNKRRLVVILISLALLSALLTYAKSGFLLTVLTMVIFAFYFDVRMRRKMTSAASIIFVLMALTFAMVSSSVDQSFAKKEEVSAVENLLNLFSAEYWRHFFVAERGWVIKEIGSQILFSLPVIGYSPDPLTAKKMIAESSGGGLAKLMGYVAFEDVYWVALFGYFGFFGMLLIFLIFYSLYSKAIRLHRFARQSGNRELLAFVSGFLSLLFILIPYCFFERVLEIQVFSYYFWMMAGIMVRQYQIQFGPPEGAKIASA